MQQRSQTVLETILLGAAIILANLRALMFIYLFPDTSVFWGPAWIEIMLWIIVVAGFTYLLIHHQASRHYFQRWRKNWLLALFLLLALVSVFWSVGPLVTLFRALELLFATLIAAYIGTRFEPEQIMEILFWFGAGLFIISIGLVFGAPKTGTMYWAPFYGAWRGIYWHRNHLASIAALLSAVYLSRGLLSMQNRNSHGVLDGLFYLVSLVILYFAKSATGYIVFLVLNASVIGIWIWLKVAHRLQRKHYIFFLAALSGFGILALSNLKFVFGLFHRDATLTGRLGLWGHLLDIAEQRLWLGHGFGAVWNLDWFREQIRVRTGWTSQPLIGDNGFLDIFLHLGILGLLLLVTILLITAMRSVRYALKYKTLYSFFPLLVIMYAIFANITFSLFAETEVFIWLVMVVALFLATPSQTAQKV